MYKLFYTQKYAKALKKLDRPTQRLITSWIEKNLIDCEDPRSRGRALVADKSGYWRYRVGSYRLISEIDDGRLTIIMIDLGHRKDIYR